jgi:hypothetical protein
MNGAMHKRVPGARPDGTTCQGGTRVVEKAGPTCSLDMVGRSQARGQGRGGMHIWEL